MTDMNDLHLCSPARIQPDCHMLFHRDAPPRHMNVMSEFQPKAKVAQNVNKPSPHTLYGVCQSGYLVAKNNTIGLPANGTYKGQPESNRHIRQSTKCKPDGAAGLAQTPKAPVFHIDQSVDLHSHSIHMPLDCIYSILLTVLLISSKSLTSGGTAKGAGHTRHK